VTIFLRHVRLGYYDRVHIGLLALSDGLCVHTHTYAGADPGSMRELMKEIFCAGFAGSISM
jgi:hypothetical protein